MEPRPAILEIAMEIAFPHEFLRKIASGSGPDAARQAAMSTSVGGIGPLLRERIFAQAEAGIDVVGVTLLYESVWVQVWHEWGQINLEKRPVGPDLRRFLSPTNLGFKMTFFDGTTCDVDVWELSYGGARVFFLSAPDITNVVYPGPKDMPEGTTNPYAWAHEIRLKHSWLVGRGALMLSQKLNRRPDIAILSETPTIFSHHRLVSDSLQRDPFFSDTRYIFNDHTPLEYAHPIWDLHTLEMVKLDPAIYNGTPAWNAQKKTLDVTSLLVSASDGVYGVARKHGDVMRAMPSLREFAAKIKYVTNGVRKEDWQAPEFANPDATDEQLIEAKNKHRKALVDWAWRHCHLWPTWAQKAATKRVVVWTRRITPYKRLDILVKVLRNPEWKARFKALNLVIFVGGRVHQQDNEAQDIVYDLLETLEGDKDLQEMVIPVDNFNVWEAPLIFRGADGAVMLADDTREASATGFMKAQMNGGAILATADGAVPEFVKFSANGDSDSNGFLIPYNAGAPTPLGLLEALENFDRTYKDPARAAAFMRSAIAVTPHVDVARTVEEMKTLYRDVLTTPVAR